ncbi:Response regulator receiver domain-containing protein [Siphonobacter aquaeclarae]|uniref:Response regulator receiver domain-containing protein n=2 Tax=Siphonobacter aquaeclarae TaxID=563176 RepID=A0A1G9X805_9BACT|nr:Response regulator receiver domain-containing protein [Siphonobacter aquaeclarae]
MDMKVLIVDDEEDLCLLLGSFLRRKQADVSYANNLTEGLEQFQSGHPDVVFLDNNLPDGIGLDVLPDWRRRHPDSRIVMISAMSNLREKALASGADAFLEKPLSFHSVEAVLR